MGEEWERGERREEREEEEEEEDDESVKEKKGKEEEIKGWYRNEFFLKVLNKLIYWAKKWVFRIKGDKVKYV